MEMKRCVKIIGCLLLLIYNIPVNGQKALIDSLDKLIFQAKSDSLKIDLLLEKAFKLPPNSAMEVLIEVEKLALKNKFLQRAGTIQFSIGTLQYHLKNYDTSIDYFLTAASSYNASGLHFKISNCYFNVAQIHATFKDDVSSAIGFAKKSLSIRDSIKHRLGTIEASTRIAQYYARLGNLNDAKSHLEKTESLLTKTDTVDYVLFYQNAVVIFGELNQLNLAEEYGQKSLELSLYYKDSVNLGINLVNLGHVFKLSGDFTTAISYYNRATKLYDELGSIEGQTNTLTAIADIRSEMKLYEEAMEYYKQALKIHQVHNKTNVGQPSGVAEVHLGMAKTLMSKDTFDYQEVLNHLLKSDSIFTTKEMLRGKIKAGFQLGTLYSKNGEPHKSIGVLSEVISLNKQKATEDLNSNHYALLGSNYTSLGDYKWAKIYLNQADSLSSLSNNLSSKLFTARKLQEYYEAKNEQKSALAVSKQIVALKDSLYEKEKIKQIVIQDRIYDIANKNKIIVENELKLQKKNYENTFMAIFIFGLLMLLVYLSLIHI